MGSLPISLVIGPVLLEFGLSFGLTQIQPKTIQYSVILATAIYLSLMLIFLQVYLPCVRPQYPPQHLAAFTPAGLLATVSADDNKVKLWPCPTPDCGNITKPQGVIPVKTKPGCICRY